ncbi:SDR family oxidoreductase [Citricoccus alkalitolerans]|uniref:SDR family oxidoreductase n=1 Tax=Citricoccus alkalitolerans TaxID=246603 RepID=A0ABV8XV28_9MICC
MTKNSVHRVAIVTGGSKGIGAATAQRLASDGYAVVVNYAHDAEVAEAAVQSITDNGGTAVAIQADVADERAVVDLFNDTATRFGGVDVLVHSAGRMDLGSLVEFDLDILDDMHRSNIRGFFVVAQRAARRLRPGGALIGLSSSVTSSQLPRYAAYAATKGAMEAATLILARELRGRDVTVNTVAPGPTATSLFLDGKTEEELDHFAKIPPLERLGRPEDIADTIAFLASPAGHWVNGQVIRANGGAI